MLDRETVAGCAQVLRQIASRLELTIRGRFRHLKDYPAGFDAGVDDPIGGFTLRDEDFALLTRELMNRTAESASRRVVSLLEGGYNPEELGRNVVAHLTAMRDVVKDAPAGATGEPEGDAAGGSPGDEVGDAGS